MLGIHKAALFERTGSAFMRGFVPVNTMDDLPAVVIGSATVVRLLVWLRKSAGASHPFRHSSTEASRHSHQQHPF